LDSGCNPDLTGFAGDKSPANGVTNKIKFILASSLPREKKSAVRRPAGGGFIRWGLAWDFREQQFWPKLLMKFSNENNFFLTI